MLHWVKGGYGLTCTQQELSSALSIRRLQSKEGALGRAWTYCTCESFALAKERPKVAESCGRNSIKLGLP